MPRLGLVGEVTPQDTASGTMLGDEVMAAALIDRLLHQCHIVNVRGNRYGMREHRDLLRTAGPDQEAGQSRAT